jgi:hypothetical protein
VLWQAEQGEKRREKAGNRKQNRWEFGKLGTSFRGQGSDHVTGCGGTRGRGDEGRSSLLVFEFQARFSPPYVSLPSLWSSRSSSSSDLK